jgi:hypothetical protein
LLFLAQRLLNRFDNAAQVREFVVWFVGFVTE